MLFFAVTPAPAPFVIQTSQAPPTWIYLMPLLGGLATVVAAVIAYFAARQQSRGTLESTRLQLASDKEARDRAEQVEKRSSRGG